MTEPLQEESIAIYSAQKPKSVFSFRRILMVTVGISAIPAIAFVVIVLLQSTDKPSKAPISKASPPIKPQKSMVGSCDSEESRYQEMKGDSTISEETIDGQLNRAVAACYGDEKDWKPAYIPPSPEVDIDSGSNFGTGHSISRSRSYSQRSASGGGRRGGRRR